MNEVNHQNRVGPLPTTLALLVLAWGGLSLLESPLKTSRPAASSLRTHPVTGDEDVEARLWQDPFQVVHKYVASEPDQAKDGMHDVSVIHERIRTWFRLRQRGEKLLILPVMVTGGPYANDAENRLRTRYALVSALITEKYTPADGEHVGFFRLPWRRTEKLTNKAEDQPDEKKAEGDLRLPYEWFNFNPIAEHNRTKEFGSVLVIWLDEDSFAEAPLLRLWRCVSIVLDGLELGDSSWNQFIQVKAMGPVSSTTLRAMLNENELLRGGVGQLDYQWREPFYLGLELLGERGQKPGDAGEDGESNTTQLHQKASTAVSQWTSQRRQDFGQEVLQGMRAELSEMLGLVDLYSYRATAAPWLLVRELGWSEDDQPSSEQRQIREVLGRYGLDFVRTIGTDDRLVRYLLEELNRRREIRLIEEENQKEKERSHIALIAESDTFYGRAWPETFREVLADMRREGLDEPADVAAGKVDQQIHEYTYLRGVDGCLPRPSMECRLERVLTKLTEDAPQRGQTRDGEALARPEGRSQFDYLRRLAREIELLDRELEYQGRGGIKAVGILGSDVYDKLLLLQALRGRLPQAIFFTTDLDARLYHPSELEWTRNLIVASHFGLRLREHLQRDTPPFRDSYQTSLFYSTLIALGEEGYAYPPPPRLYEIGLNGPYDLSFTSRKEVVSSVDKQNPHRRRQAGMRWHERVGINPLYGAFALLLGVILLVALSTHCQRLVFGPPKAAGQESRSVAGREAHPRKHLALAILGLVLVVAVGLCWLYYKHRYTVPEHDPATAEPFALFQGISIWPTEALRLLAALLAVAFLVIAWCDLRESDEKLLSESALCGSPSPERKTPPQEASSHCPQDNSPEENPASPNNGPKKKAASQLWRTRKGVWLSFKKPITFWLGRNTIAFWDWPANGKTSVRELWSDYKHRGSTGNRGWRVGLATLIYGLFGLCLMLCLRFPVAPARDGFSRSVDIFCLFISVVSMIVLIFFVVDATRLCRRFITHLSSSATEWPLEARQEYGRGRSMSSEPLAEWLKVKLIAARTVVSGRLIYYPFIVLLIMILSRHSCFDNWDWPASLIIIFGLNSLYAVACVFMLRRAAERARDNLVAGLNEQLLGGTGRPEEDSVKQIERTIERIRSMKEGAFAPFLRQPVVAAALLPFGGIGGLALLEHLGRAF